MIEKVLCPKCGGANYTSDNSCLNCGASLQVQQSGVVRHAVAVREPAPGMNSAMAAVVGLLGIVLVVVALATWLDVTMTPEKTIENFHGSEIVQRELPAVAFAAKLIFGPLLIIASVGLFRLRRWAWMGVVGFFGVGFASHVVYMIAVISHGLFPTMLAHLFQPPLYFGFEVRLGGDIPFFIGLMILKPIISLVIQSLILGYYVSIRDRFAS
ncbi:MAG: hypothetical protein ABJA67_06245 [Chthonomonadales bacterium]